MKSIAGLFLPLAAAHLLPAQAATRTATSETFLTAQSVYEYNAKATSRLDTVSTDSSAGYVRRKLTLSADLAPRFPFYLVTPRSGRRPFPVALLVHGYTSTKEQWFWPQAALADSLGKAGFAVVALDAPYHGDRAGESGYRMPTNLIDLRNMAIQWAIEHRRVLDALGPDTTLDVNHSVIVGYSLGTVVAFALAAVDTRVTEMIAAVTPIGGPPNAKTVTIDPRTFAPTLHIPVLMLMGTKDEYYTPAEARAFYDQIVEKRKELVFFESGHMLPDVWVSRAVSWLTRSSR